MISPHPPDSHALAKTLILDELFDLSLYEALRDISQGDVQKMLEELIQVEKKHLVFWENFFSISFTALDVGRRLKLRLIVLACRLYGYTAIHLVLEAIEVYGIRKYLAMWKMYKDGPMGGVLRDILVDEFQHEDTIVSRLTERKINPERIRNIFFGLNDGLVEILGAVSGFFAAFGNSAMVLIAASTTAVAGAISMAAGAYVALGSEQEVKKTETAKNEFLNGGPGGQGLEEHPLSSSLVVGGAYIIGAMVPVFPVIFGATDALYSLLAAGTTIVFVSMLLAFLSGMDVKRRIVTNLVIIAGAVGVTYAIGTAARHLFGIEV